ncbi:MAG: hypothetical protein H3C43_04510 [Leptonema sp. (in: Bacteria)]|nr:hypothetical protein [Leptonema sp. (in: bacteria)]
MQNFNRLKEIGHLKIPSFRRDGFQDNVFKNMYLEFFLENCRVLFTPDFQYLTTGPTKAEELEAIELMLKEERELINELKQYVLYNLSLYSALLETNSYYVASNNHLLICRFVYPGNDDRSFELKLYTLAQQDLPENYKDKLYIGRDFVNISRLNRDHFGLREIRDSLKSQVAKMRNRVKSYTPHEIFNEINEEYINEIDEIIVEFSNEATNIIEEFPVDITTKSLKSESLIQVNHLFRGLKHMLIEIEETTRDMEARMFDTDLSRSVRYVTKFRKDIQNYINYIVIKINGRITDAVNGFHL